MVSIDDVFNELQSVNANLHAVEAELTQTNQILTRTEGDVSAIKTLAEYSAVASSHLSKQSDTIICILEKISHNTCDIVNEEHQQTGFQKSIDKHASRLLHIYESVHGSEAIAAHRIHEMEEALLACCPPKPEHPPCTYGPCDKPAPLQDPPTIESPVV